MKKSSAKEKNANYDFKQVDPAHPMGHGQYANMPEKPMLLKFSGKHGYRDGIVNNFTVDVEAVSDIDENMRS